MRLAPLLLVALALAVGAVTALAWRGAGAAARAELEERGRALVPVVRAALREGSERAAEAVLRERQRLLAVARRARTEVALALGPVRDRLDALAREEDVGRVALLDAEGAISVRVDVDAVELPPAQAPPSDAEELEGLHPPSGLYVPPSSLDDERHLREVVARLLPEGVREASEGLRLNAFASAYRIVAAVRTKDGGALLLATAADHLAEAQRGLGARAVLEGLAQLPDVRGLALSQAGEVLAAVGDATRPGDLQARGSSASEAATLDVVVALSRERVDGLVAAERARILLYGALAGGAALLAAVLLLRRDRAETLRRARAEAAQREQQRLAEMGVLTGLFVHEVSNPLNALGLQLEAVKRAAGGAGGEEIQRVKGTLARVRQALESFLSVATPVEGRAGEIYDVARLKRTLDDLRSEAPRALLDLEVAPDARVLGVAARVPVLDQALRNLLRNALQAAPEASTVRLAWQAAEGGVALVVRDHGPGFPAQVLENGGALGVSGRREGHGLGLFLARRIVEGLGGRLELSNPAEGGAQVHVWLPAAPRAASQGGMAS
jgi:signal transduction histidine kinase